MPGNNTPTLPSPSVILNPPKRYNALIITNYTSNSSLSWKFDSLIICPFTWEVGLTINSKISAFKFIQILVMQNYSLLSDMSKDIIQPAK